jgi:hypothetical protein
MINENTARSSGGVIGETVAQPIPNNSFSLKTQILFSFSK